MHIGLLLEYGGVGLASSSSKCILLTLTVIFQQPRPGPPLPKAEHYITIGWKQVCPIRLSIHPCFLTLPLVC
jgi:hypothetical protein